MYGVSSSLASTTAAYAASRRTASAGKVACTDGSCGTCSSCSSSKAGDTSTGTSANGKALSADQQKQVESLKQRDAEVRQHEAAHLAAAGGFAKGGPVYNYKSGPDGKQYAVGGHVDVDTSAVAGDPKATLAKARQVQRAALAPADPSGQDHAVAASAAAQAAKAQTELSAERAGSAAGGDTADAASGKKSKSTQVGGAAATAYAKASPQAAPAGGGLDVLG